jgi:SAM-dependent methyltransferase
MKVHPEKDAFGNALYDHFRHRPACAVVERDDGYTDVERDLHHYFADYKHWPRIEQRAIKLARGRVLDVGAGAGRHSLHLQKTGCRVTAIDVSPLALKVCRLRGVKDCRLVSLFDFKTRGPEFDAVIMFGNNFAVFGSRSRARKALKALYRQTTPGAVILGEVVDPYRTDNRAHLRYHRLNRERGRMGGQVRIRIRYHEHTGLWFDYFFVSPAELEVIVKGIGWRVARYFKDSGPVYIVCLVKAPVLSR